MKKILSLLVLLVTTLSAFALDFTDYRKVTLGSNTPTESNDAKLSITDNGDGTYNVTFNDIINKDGSYTDNYGTFTFSNVSGSQTGDFTTVTGTSLTGTVTGGDYGLTEFTDGELLVKFKEGKAYATMTAKCKVFYSSYTFNVVFGTDEGFEGGGSTGGGETGGEDKPAIVDVVEADYAPNGAAFGFPFTINWETQKLVAKLDLSTCSRYTHNEGIITVGTDNGNGDVSLWEPNNGEANCHLYYTHYNYGNDEKLLNFHYLEKPSGTVKRVDSSLQNLEPGLVVFTFDKDGLHVGDNLIASPGEMETLYNSTSLIFGSKEGSTRSYATYKYVKVVPADWTEPTEPEVTEVSSKSFEDKLYAFADGENIEQGNATVKISNMSDETIKMSLVFGDTTIESANIEQGTDDKGRTTYTGTADWEGVNFAVSAVVYTKDEAEKIYMTLTSNDAKYTVGTDPDYVAPEPPAGESTIVENWQSTEGVAWSHDATIDWNTQKLVVSVNLASTGSDKGFLGVTKKGNTPGWNNDGIIFYNTNGSTIQGYAPGQPNNANTDQVTKGEDPVRFEISKDGGVVCQGNVVISASNIAHLTAESEIVVGAADKTAGALYNYIKVVSLDWTEPTTPDTPEAVAYKNELTIVRGANHKVYNDAEVTVLAKGEGKYEVTLPEFADMDLTNSGTVGKIVFTANGEEVDGVLKLTAENAAGVISTGEGWTSYAAAVTMSGDVENGQLAAKFTVVLGGMSDYTYELGFGKEIFIPTTQTFTDWANVKFGGSDAVNIENAKLDITMVSASTAKLTFKDVTINGNNIGDFAISGVKASLNPEDYTTILTTEATKGTWVRATENNALGVIVGAESDIRNFEGSQDEEAGKTIVKFGVFFGSAYGWADIVFGEKVETPDQPKGDYAINFDKDANSTHSSRVLNSFSLQQTGKDKQTKSVKTSKAAYEDHTADEPFTVEAGSELTASFDYTGEWMHSFVYIDFDNDGDFSYKEGQWDQTGTDLVAFSFYSLDSNPKNDASGYNSVGDELTGDARNTYVAPSFKAPAKAGEYRIRFKIDWNCILPGGSSSILSDGGGVWDATLKVVEPVVDGISTINAEVANGEAQLFTVDGVQIAKLQKGLNIVRTADGKVKKVLVK
mgnify:CR=1 FL=1